MTQAVSPEQYKTLIEGERALCFASLRAHIAIACEKTFDEAVHGDILDAYQRAADGEPRGQDDFYELIAMLPRGHFKTTLFACIATWEIARDRNTTICIVGSVHSIAADTVFVIRQLLESDGSKPDGGRLAEVYGPFQGESVWNNEELVVRGRSETMRESTVKAMGIESFKPGGHFQILWFDDPEDQATVNTTDLRAKTRQAYALGRPMADKPGSRRWLTGTFWDDDDLYCHLIEQYGLGKVDSESGRLVCVNGSKSKNGKQILFYKPAEDEDGNPLFPSRFPREILNEIRDEMEFQSPGSYDKQYLLNPVTNKSARFKPEDYVTAPAPPPGVLDVSFGMDFAQSKTEGSDRSAIVGAFDDPDYMFYIFEATELAINAEAQQDAIFSRHAAFPKARFFVEADNFVKGWLPHFEIRCRQKGIFPLIEWIDAGARAKKDDRIFATEGLFRMKRVVFLPGTSLLWSQLSRMPASRRKDVADAWANIAQFKVVSLDRPVAPQKLLRGYEKLVQSNAGPAPWESDHSKTTPYAGKRGDSVPWPAS